MSLSISQSYNPKKGWLLGYLGEFRDRPFQFLEHLSRSHPEKDIVKTPMGAWDVHVVLGSKAVQEVLLKNTKNFPRSKLYKRLGHFLGRSILTAEGDRWKMSRSFFQPLFSADCLDHYKNVIERHASQMEEDWSRAARLGHPINFSEELTRVTMEIIFETLLGSKVEGLDRLSRAFSICNETIGERIFSGNPLGRYIPHKKNRDFNESLRELHELLRSLIVQRKKQGPSGEGDLLDKILFSGGKELFSESDMIDEILSFAAAGHDTTAAGLTWTMILLSRYPRHMEALGEEARAYDWGTNTCQSVMAQKQSQSIFLESLRLYPPAWFVSRDALEDTEIEGHTIKSGSTVVVSPYLLQRSSRYWEEPLEFRPERFFGGIPKGEDRFKYMPFGAGPHLCIGYQFSLIEAGLLLLKLAKNLKFLVRDPFSIQPVAHTTLKTSSEVWGRVFLAEGSQEDPGIYPDKSPPLD